MAIYSDLQKLGRVKLPSNTTYALVDVDGRAMMAPNWAASTSYAQGDYVVYQDNIYRCDTANSDASWTSAKWTNVTVGAELKRIEGLVAGGINYRGKTSTELHDGDTTNPITMVSGGTLTAAAGDLVIMDLNSVSTGYAVNTAYSVGTYIKYTISSNTSYWLVEKAITAADNISWNIVKSNCYRIPNDPEFLFDGTAWNELGPIGDGLGQLAFKNSANGQYVKPTGSGTVTINTYGASKKYLETTSITGTDGTVNATNITSVATGTFATAGTAVVYGTADVGTALSVGTALGGTTTFVTDALYAAELSGTTTFNTDAIKAATLSGTTTFTTSGVVATVDGDCLQFASAGTGTVTINTTSATTATVSLSTTAASATQKASVTLTTSSITPAKSADTTRKLTPVGGTGTVVTGVTYSSVTPAKAASLAVRVATGKTAGSDTSGDEIAVDVTSSTSSATVSVGTTTAVVTVD